MSGELVLVVEDEPDIVELVSFHLKRDGFRVVSASDGEEALSVVRSALPDIILLDLMLPGLDGLEVCRRLRAEQRTASVPVIMLTSRSEDADVVAGLEIGAADYITKPFSPRVLVARVRAVLRRGAATRPGEDSSIVNAHGVSLDPARHEASFNGSPLDLSATEFAILELLATNPGRVYSRSQIIDSVKGRDYPVTERSVDVHILGLRKKLRGGGELIQTVRGVGYRLRSE